MALVRIIRGAALTGALSLWAAAALAAAPLIDERISPARITIGDSAQITVRTSGNDLEPPQLPLVPGLELRIIDRLHGIELVHGASLATTTTLVRVTPQHTGTFIIPEVSPAAPPLTLRVDPVSIGTASAAAPPDRTAGAGIRMMQDDDAFIRVTVPQRAVYVGESVPVSIEVGMRGGVVTSLNGLPTLESSDFTLNNLSRRPERSERIIADKPYVVLTWHSVLAPVKPGQFSLSVEAPMTVRVSTRPRREVELEDRLGDPFMQRVFGATVSKPLQAVSLALSLTVSPLPAEGQPAGFSGAVGRFQMSSGISAAAAAAGDPLTLRMHVTGAGNFDRVDSPMLQHVEGWKTYPPTASFKPADAQGLTGDKTFEQPVIASRSGEQTLPGLTFTYFDPETRHYETARSAPLAVVISSSSAAPSPGVLPLHADRVTPGTTANELTPLYLQRRFLAIPALLSVIAAAAWLPGRRAGDVPSRPARSRQSRAAAHRALALLDAAAHAGDSERFFALARQILPPQAASAEFDAGRDDERDQLRHLLLLADESLYAARTLSAAELARWAQVVRRSVRAEPWR